MGRVVRCINTANFEVYFPGLHQLKPELRELIDLTDPDVEYVIDAIRLMNVAGCDVQDPEVLKLAIKAGHARAASVHDDTSLEFQDRQERWLEKKAVLDRSMQKHEAKARVYYARLGNRLKIGYTHNVRKRMAQLMPEELMATEPGGEATEAERHQQFARLRTHGEWFRYENELVEHVEALRQKSAAS